MLKVVSSCLCSFLWQDFLPFSSLLKDCNFHFTCAMASGSITDSIFCFSMAESVIILPAFGVQLETQYRRFSILEWMWSFKSLLWLLQRNFIIYLVAFGKFIFKRLACHLKTYILTIIFQQIYFKNTILYSVFATMPCYPLVINTKHQVFFPWFLIWEISDTALFSNSGRVIRHFVPISKILKPVLNECVTPVTCYWSLALIIRGEEQLMLVFKVLCLIYSYYCQISMLFALANTTLSQTV